MRRGEYTGFFTDTDLVYANLPFELGSISELTTFKKKLKTYLY